MKLSQPPTRRTTARQPSPGTALRPTRHGAREAALPAGSACGIVCSVHMPRSGHWAGSVDRRGRSERSSRAILNYSVHENFKALFAYRNTESELRVRVRTAPSGIVSSEISSPGV